MAVQDGRDPGTDAYKKRLRRLRNTRRAARSRAAALSKKAKSVGKRRQPSGGR